MTEPQQPFGGNVVPLLRVARAVDATRDARWLALRPEVEAVLRAVAASVPGTFGGAWAANRATVILAQMEGGR